MNFFAPCAHFCFGSRVKCETVIFKESSSCVSAIGMRSLVTQGQNPAKKSVVCTQIELRESKGVYGFL
jgi:hypothetical protein